jgi:hypothetical protein
MPRWLSVLLGFVCPVVVFACNDDLVQEVGQDVCFSGKQWIGGRRGSPTMYPGRDCVGCHLENDGPQLMLGGTVYPYTTGDLMRIPSSITGEVPSVQTGEDCFGEPGQNIVITGADGQAFDLITNEAGNFFVEGNPEDLVKPFSAVLNWTSKTGNVQATPMLATFPSYGGCARCHTVGAMVYPPPGSPPDFEYSLDEKVSPPGSAIGMPGYLVPPRTP